MNIIRSLYLNYLVKKDKNFLLKKGLKKAKENGLELRIEGEFLNLNNSVGKIELPFSEKGTDVRKLIALVADDYPKITKRYLTYKELLEDYSGTSSKA